MSLVRNVARTVLRDNIRAVLRGAGGGPPAWTPSVLLDGALRGSYTDFANVVEVRDSRGPELVNNGTFDSNITGWTAQFNTPVWDAAGRIHCTTTAINPRTYQYVTVEVGKWYMVSGEITYGTQGTGTVSIGLTVNNGEYTSVTGEGQFARYILARSASLVINLKPSGTVGDNAYFDNISVREITGTPLVYQTTAGSMASPALAAGDPIGLVIDPNYTLGPNLIANGTFDGGDLTGWTISETGGVPAFTVDAEGRLSQAVPGYNGANAVYSAWSPEADKVYLLEFDFWDTGGQGFVSLGGTSLGQPTEAATNLGAGPSVRLRYFVRTASTGQLTFAGNANYAWKLDNISVREVYGIHLYQDTTAAKPALGFDAGGYAHAQFDGVDDGLKLTSNGWGFGSGTRLDIALAYDTQGTDTAGLFLSNSTTNNPWIHAWQDVAVSTAAGTGTSFVNVRVNGTEVATTSITRNDLHDAMNVGKAVTVIGNTFTANVNYASPWVIGWYITAIYNFSGRLYGYFFRHHATSVLTTEERQSLEAYMANRIGVTLA